MASLEARPALLSWHSSGTSPPSEEHAAAGAVRQRYAHARSCSGHACAQSQRGGAMLLHAVAVAMHARRRSSKMHLHAVAAAMHAQGSLHRAMQRSRRVRGSSLQSRGGTHSSLPARGGKRSYRAPLCCHSWRLRSCRVLCARRAQGRWQRQVRRAAAGTWLRTRNSAAQRMRLIDTCMRGCRACAGRRLLPRSQSSVGRCAATRQPGALQASLLAASSAACARIPAGSTRRRVLCSPPLCAARPLRRCATPTLLRCAPRPARSFSSRPCMHRRSCMRVRPPACACAYA
jgi:hypothetical protein